MSTSIANLSPVQPRHEAQRIVAVDQAKFGVGKSEIDQALGGHRRRDHREVGAEHDLARRHQPGHGRERVRIESLRRVEKEFSQLRHRAVRQTRLQFLAAIGPEQNAAHQERQRAAAMRKNEADIGKARGGSAEHQARYGARGFSAVFQDRVDQIRHQIGDIGAGRMDVGDGVAAVELSITAVKAGSPRYLPR